MPAKRMAQSHLVIFLTKLEPRTHVYKRDRRSECTWRWRGNEYLYMKTLVMGPGDGVKFWGMDKSRQRSLTCDTLVKAMLDGSPQENLDFWLPRSPRHMGVCVAGRPLVIDALQSLPETYMEFLVTYAEEVPCAFLRLISTMQLARVWNIKMLQDRQRPLLRPPRSNLTLGGTNLRDDIVETSSSTSGSEEGGWVDTMFPIFSMSFRDGSFGSEVLATFSEIASTRLECCPL